MKEKINNTGIFLQMLLFAFIIVALLVSIFINEFINVVYGLISLTMFVMSYNNYKLYKRKYFTPLYFVFGVILMITTILGVINAR